MLMLESWLRRLAPAFLAFRGVVAADERGSVNILFGLSLIPIVGLAGLGVDYGVAQAVKSKLDNAADSAAVAAVATAKAYVAANPNDTNLTVDAINAGMNRAGRAFTTNAGALPFAAVPSNGGSNSGSNCNVAGIAPGGLQIGLVRSTDGTTFTSCVAYKTQTQNHFGQIFKTPVMTEQGTASALAKVPQFLDFYLLVDVSGSMGLPASQSDANTMLASVGCQFACHFPGNNNNAGWNYAINNSIVLRSGAVNIAVCALLQQALAEAMPNEYRVGVYPFITQMATLAAASTSLSSVQSQSGCNQPAPSTFTYLLDTGTTQLGTSPYAVDGTGAGGTHFDLVMPAIQSVISNGFGFGNGTASTNSKPFVFLITDGMNNSQYFSYPYQYNGQTYELYSGNPSHYGNIPNAYWNGGSNPAPIGSSVCTNLQQAGATVGVLYIPYQPITVGPQNQGETVQANAAIPSLPSALTSCASSPAYFYTANSTQDITNALIAMFNQANQAAHLTQ